IVAAGLLGSLLFAASASAKTLKPSGEGTAHRIGPNTFKGKAPAERPRAVPLKSEKQSALDRGKDKLGRPSTPGPPHTPLAPHSGPSQWAGLLWSDNASYNLGTPPDTTGAIGPNSYIEFVNSVLRSYNRTTLATQDTAQEDVFTGPTGRRTFDPQIQWNQ